MVSGSVAPGFERVADAFEQVLEESAGGAAFAAYARGDRVVDLWGGNAEDEARKPWRPETIQLVFSGTKGLVATCVLLLVERGLLDLETPVASYWPEFAAERKGEITVGQAVSHMAALPGLRGGFTADDLLDPDRMEARTAAEAPFWEPGTQVAYHALTYGWICGGLVRRVDGRSIGRFVAEEVAGPLGLDLWIGLPEEQENRVARLVPAVDYGITYLGDEPEPLLEAVYGSILGGGAAWNEPSAHRAEIPGANAIGDARSIARLYACLAEGGELDGVRLLSEEAVRHGRAERSRGICAITRRPYAFAVGFELQTELMRFGPPLGAFGHTGSGGSTHGCWPDERVGFSYAMTELWPEARDDRGQRLLAALAASL
jgi:CubicO group peptidase (beta-lactamase class C family)